MIWYHASDNPFLTLTCTNEDCSDCEGPEECTWYTVTVSSEKTASDLQSLSDCKYGDTVKIESNNGIGFVAFEIAILGKEGNQLELNMLNI